MNKWSVVILLSVAGSFSALAHPGHGEAPGTAAHLLEHAGLAAACLAVVIVAGISATRAIGRRAGERKRK